MSLSLPGQAEAVIGGHGLVPFGLQFLAALKRFVGAHGLNGLRKLFINLYDEGGMLKRREHEVHHLSDDVTR